MKIQRAFKTQLDPNNQQVTAFIRHCGVARFAYNWGLERKKAAMEAGEKLPSAFTLSKELNGIKRTEYAWMLESSKWAPAEALRDLDSGFDNFFRRCKERKAGKQVKAGFPRFRSRKNGIGSFRVYAYRVLEDSIQLPKIGKVRLKQKNYLPIGGIRADRPDVKYLGATISERAGKWFVSINVEIEIPDPQPKPSTTVVGVDFGIKVLATCSDGTTFENPKAYKRNLRKLKRLSRSLNRKQKGSANRDKAKQQVARLHYRIANIRSHALHQISSHLTRESSCVVIENLNVAGMVKNRHLAQAIGDCGFAELRRQLEYKGLWYGCDVLLADRFFPSSKKCSSCGAIREVLRLEERTFRCECGFTCDRDLNAALNLKNFAGRMPENSNACGCGGSGLESIPSETAACEAGTIQLLLFEKC